MADSRYAGEVGLQAVFGQIKAAIAEKQDKINDMGLSHNDYSNAEKQKNAQNASDIVALNNDIDDIIEKRDGDATLYQFAPVVTVEDAVPGNVALRAKVEPTQDLHGQSVPYVGGAGKNKLPLTVAGIKAGNTSGTWDGNTYTLLGVTYTLYTDDGNNITGIKVNGSYNGASTYLSFWIPGRITLPAGSYKYTSGMTATQANLRIRCNDGGFFSYTTNEIAKTYAQDTNVDIEIVMNSGDTVENAMLYPMIRLSTETDANFAPYTNICPIAQYDSCKITRIGKNLLRNDLPASSTLAGVNLTTNDDGSVYCNGTITNTGYTRLLNSNVELKPNNTYIISGMVANIGLRLYALDKDGNELGRATCYATPVQFTVPSGTANVYCNILSGAKNKVVDDTVYPQVEKAEQATAWKPYKSNYYSIELNGNTYYGQLRIDTQGNVYFDVDRALVDLGNLDYVRQATGTSEKYRFNSVLTNAKPVESNNDKPNALCSVYDIVTPSNTYGCIDGVTVTTSGAVNIYVENYKDATAEDFKSAMDGVQFCYELATPFTIVLKDTPINLVKGQNTIYADTGDVEVIVNNTMDAIGSVQEQANNLVDVIGWNDRKNKANISNKVNGYINNNIQPGNTIEYISSAATVSYEKIAYVYANKKYMLSWDIDGTATVSALRNGCIIDDDRKVVQSSLPTWVSKQKYYPITPVADGWLCISVDNKTINIQLEEGGEFTGYEPYHKQIGPAVEELLNKVPDAPTTDGAYVLTVTVAGGVPKYSWESAE